MVALKLTVVLVLALATPSACITQAGRVNVKKLGTGSGCPVRPWTAKETAERERLVAIKFKHPFASPPLVTASISALDSSKRANVRIGLTVEDLTEEGFTLKVGTWCDTWVYWVQATWTAYTDVFGTGMKEIDA
ncbi:hypothetical protein BSKO_05691 [Bryopsis sp. KO-2023]|nr:hypothetical protein BSKO_05691 [Bryopsis sp. KO-2023]